MKLATTTGDYDAFALSVEERIRRLHQAGFRHIDLNLYEEITPDSRFLKPDWQDYTRSLLSLAQSLGMDFVQAHAPNVNPLRRDETWEQAVAYVQRSIEVCGLLDIPNTVLHAGWAPGIGREEYFRQNLEFLARLFPTMGKWGVTVCVENSTRANMGQQYYFYTGEDMADFLRYAGHPLLKACWDTGHANIEGHQYSDLIALGDKLGALHINDNRGQKDEHIMPFLGSLSLDEVMHGLQDIGYRGVFTFEACSTLPFHNDWLLTRNAYGHETRLLDPPLELQQQMEATLYHLGVYILKRYDCFEE